MKLILQFGLAALLVAFLAVPSLAEKQAPAPPSPVPIPYPIVEPPKTQAKRTVVKDSHDSYAPSPAPKVEQPKTQTGSQALPPSGVKGESKPQPLPAGGAKVTSKDFSVTKPMDKSSPTLMQKGTQKGSKKPQPYLQYKMKDVLIGQ
jgi:hypothetical protein